MKTLGSILKNYKELYAVPADTTAHDAAVYMTDRNIGAVTVVEGDRVVGLFSERDLMKRVVAAGRDPKSIKVADVMTTELTMAAPDESYADGISKMHQARCRHLPVLEENKLLGLVSLRDLLEVDVDEKAEEIRLLNTYINYVPPGL
ncbi:MAG TPA: CBS domain-containing protein [Blastocatellia bacterium]|nr:CBS domain-containing protein [Blastocatellia bacterium]